MCKVGLDWDNVLYAKAVPLGSGMNSRSWSEAIDLKEHVGNIQERDVFQATGLTAYNSKRYFTSDPRQWLFWNPPKGEWEIHIFVEREVRNFKYFGKYIDPCNEDAVKAFIRFTHERYAREVGEFFGSTIKGMFTDEVGFLGDLPWTPSLPRYFQERNGYDLKLRLHELICSQSETCKKTRYDYFQSLHELLRDRYHRPLREWCEKYGLQYVAEAPSMRATTQIHSHIPAADNGHEKAGLPLSEILDKCLQNIRYNPKMASSLASQLKREKALVECFHSVGWSMTLQDAKWMIDRLAALGVNFFNFHAFFYSTDDLRKFDAPPSLFFQNPYWRYFHLLSDYAARVSALMGRTRPVIEIAVLDPTTSLWTRMGNPMEGFAGRGCDDEEKSELKRLKSDWDSICKTLLLGFRDYEHVDPDLLTGAEVRDRELQIGISRYKALILPPMSNLERVAWNKVHEFIQAGGVVISYGLLPTEIIENVGLPVREVLEDFGVGEESVSDYWKTESFASGSPCWGTQRACFVPCCGDPSSGISLILSLLDELLPPKFRFCPEKSDGSFIVHQRRGDDESRFFFITNQSDAPFKAKLVVSRLAGKASSFGAILWGLETGELKDLRVENGLDGSVVALEFAPYQSFLVEIAMSEVILTEQQVSLDVERLTRSNSLNIEAGPEWVVELEDQNALRLSRFDLAIAGEFLGRNLEAKPFINLCQELELPLGLRYDQSFGTPVRVSVAYPIHCSFRSNFLITELPSTCRLIIEGGSIRGEFVISINGHSIQKSDFRSDLWLGQEKQVCEICSLLKSGENELWVEVIVADDSHGVVDSLYLVGDFGVYFDRYGLLTMSAVPQTLNPFTDVYPGLPFFAGTFTCRRSFDMSEIQGQKFIDVSKDVGGHFRRIAELLLNGTSLGCRAWSPYRWAVPDSLLLADKNLIEIRITTGLEGLFEGRYFDSPAHRMKNLSTEEMLSSAELSAIANVGGSQV